MARITAFNLIRSSDWGETITCCCCPSPEREVNLKDVYTELVDNIWVCRDCAAFIEHDRGNRRQWKTKGHERSHLDISVRLFEDEAIKVLQGSL